MDSLMVFLRSLDSKLVTTVVGIALMRVLLELGGDPVGDPLWSNLIALAVGGFAGWWKSNVGSALRAPQESGNPVVPDGAFVAPADEGV
jgi:hypothetical protein